MTSVDNRNNKTNKPKKKSEVIEDSANVGAEVGGVNHTNESDDVKDINIDVDIDIKEGAVTDTPDVEDKENKDKDKETSEVKNVVDKSQESKKSKKGGGVVKDTSIDRELLNTLIYNATYYGTLSHLLMYKEFNTVDELRDLSVIIRRHGAADLHTINLLNFIDNLK